uniref:Uncharacterized protein n=1 Tax=Romanomermis culicivorax TaxID=13658 RepID=A0A915JQE6_ROMCU
MNALLARRLLVNVDGYIGNLFQSSIVLGDRNVAACFTDRFGLQFDRYLDNVGVFIGFYAFR